ncbi:EmrB/QacA subfamily drug resistance transporter [Herbihabitans rhizosphaerae]|uniref:EmrB/QacA subfamily drug resistance transporter n=1 Tax=Herbihabitans rhizosphaerae TaxID=1872711 RepID=A0A4Q7KW13_9PSEU|nr:MDR family MFS transporter [Herbihabitans rhizosphaerae]RZS41229.1 EmrB/QacA subfamily drug resistance transporter [Herbihabitans rhizosphaerae]
MSDTPAATAVEEPSAPAEGALTHRQILTVISGLMLGMLLAALDQTIVSTALKTIADELHGQTIQAWATTAYLITMTVTTPLYGKLSDIYGRRPLYLTAISIFLVGSLLCGIASSMYELALYRAIQGLGAGGLISLVFAIIGDITAPRERARYQAYFMSVWATASVLGPVLGGLFAGTDSFLGITGWRWVFLVNLPVALVALIVVTKVLHVPHKRVEHRVDYWGAATLTLAVVPVLLVAEQGREWGWGSVTSLIMYGLGLLGLASFVYVQRRMGDEALLPLRLFRHPTFSMANLLSFILGVGMFGGFASLPLYMQIVKGVSPTESGLTMLPMMVGIIVSATLSGRVISKTGRYRAFPIAGMGLLALALFLLGQLGTDSPLVLPMLMMAVFGLGLGLCMQTLLLATQSSVPLSDMGVASASSAFFRSIGGTFGTAVFLSILFTVVPDRIAAARAAAGLPQLPPGAGLDLNDTSFLNHLDPVNKRPILDGFSSAMDTVFIAGGFVMLVAFALVWFLKEVKLSDKSGTQRAAEEAAAAV